MTQPWPAPPAPVRTRNWLTVTLAAVAVVLAAAALIVALTRSGSETSPTYTAAQKAEAKTQLCDRYKLAAQAVHIETNSSERDIALARIATTNGALMLDTAAGNPAVDAKYRDAARALAIKYQDMTVLGSQGMASSEQYHSLTEEAAAKERVMQELCGD